MSLNVAIDGAPETVKSIGVRQLLRHARPRAGCWTSADRDRRSCRRRSGRSAELCLLAAAVRRITGRHGSSHFPRCSRDHRRRHAAEVPKHAASRRQTPQVAIPLTLRAALERSPSYLQADSWWVLMMARLPKGEKPSKLQPSLEERFRQSVAEGNAALTTRLAAARVPAGSARSDRVPRRHSAQTLRVMAAITTVVLLVACAIVANLLLARGQARVRRRLSGWPSAPRDGE